MNDLPLAIEDVQEILGNLPRYDQLATVNLPGYEDKNKPREIIVPIKIPKNSSFIIPPHVIKIQ
jgi:hypothetical protein